MPDSTFFVNEGPRSIQYICDLTGAEISDGVDASLSVRGVAALDRAGEFDLTFLENLKYLDQLSLTKALACFVAPDKMSKVPDNVVALVHEQPYRAFAKIAQILYPASRNPGGFYSRHNDAGGSYVHALAEIGEDVAIEPGAVVGEGACIGSGTILGAGAVIGRNVKIGKDCFIGANVSVCYALIGDQVIIHSGAQIGQDGFGFAMGADFHLKVPQLGRVIIQDNVEIGANTTIDRGSTRDTIVGEGTKIDNQVQIAHNVEIGRHCIIVGLTGISGSTRLGDFVVLGARSGLLGHLSIGDGTQIATCSLVMDDVPAGVRWGGTPAQPVRKWFREVAELRKLAGRKIKNSL